MNATIKPTSTLTALCMLGLSLMLSAQDPPPASAPPAVEEPPELVQYRAKFEQELAERLEPARTAYAKALKDLETQRAAAEDYEGAARAQRKRSTVEGIVSADSAGISSEISGAIEVELARGRRSGSSISYDSKRGALTGFERAGQHITWETMKVTPGLYSVLVTYGCAAEATGRERDDKGKWKDTKVATGGSFTFEEATNLTTGEDRVLRHTVYPTDGWDKLVTRNIGRLNLTGTTSTLKLTALEPAPGGIMHLRRLRLLPVSATAADNPENPLVKLRTQYQTKANELAADTISAQIARLKAMEESFATQERLRDALTVKGKRVELEKQASEPASVLRNLILQSGQ